MIGARAPFFVAGGTMGLDARSYVARQADADLYDGLSRGEFCYVLTARQMGKSSLMVRTAERLSAAGVVSVIIDLTQIGVQVSAAEWYFGILTNIADQLALACDVVRGLLRGEPCPTEQSFYRLRSAGVMTGQSARDVRPRCELYRIYLERHLL